MSCEVDKIPARLLKETADASAVPLNMLFNLPLNRDACLNYGNQLTSHLLIRMVTGSQWKIVEDREVDVLCKYGVGRDLVNWCRDYLTEAQRREVVKGEASDGLTVTSDVPRVLFYVINGHNDIDISNKLLFCKDRNIKYNLKENDTQDLVPNFR
ncbi:unnamed protein product [Pocillopora meandrina]|uniref:Uncharacterized protein n=1 Tax=Pocillopora meandrina TaxID=46732 RepID=A0AAU9XT62_9CNID|nr:unnamed protein product [Pocillopora meandrina]